MEEVKKSNERKEGIWMVTALWPEILAILARFFDMFGISEPSTVFHIPSITNFLSRFPEPSASPSGEAGAPAPAPGFLAASPGAAGAPGAAPAAAVVARRKRTNLQPKKGTVSTGTSEILQPLDGFSRHVCFRGCMRYCIFFQIMHLLLVDKRWIWCTVNT